MSSAGHPSSSSSTSSSGSKQRHVFLFRHCVRSLPDTIYFYDDDIDWITATNAAATRISDSGGNDRSDVTININYSQQETTMRNQSHHFSTNPQDYLSHWPEWNTPPQWCTAVGSDIMKGTGKFLFQRFLRLDENNANTYEDTSTPRRGVKFISDAAPRNVQTALAIINGVSEEEEANLLQELLQQQQQQQQQTPQQTMLQLNADGDYDDEYPPLLWGLHYIQLDSELFHHLDTTETDEQPRTKMKNEDICTQPPNEDTIRAMARRFQSIPPPGELADIMEWMERTTGHKDLFQTFFPDDDDREKRNQIKLTPSGDHFQGAWNLVKYISQAITYSLASGILLEDWIDNNNKNNGNNITTADYYNLMAWEHWSRHIFNMGNNLAAAQGGIMMVRILQELGIDTLATNDDNNDGNEDYDIGKDYHGEENGIVATFIIGHEEEIDAVATALGISWNLPPPYHPGYTPTPPGSAIHFALDYESGEIEVSFMAPMFFSNSYNDHEGGGRLNYLNASGVLVEVPVEFVDAGAEGGGESSSAAKAAVFPSLDALRNHTLNTLRGYSGSEVCFRAAENVSAAELLPQHHGTTTTTIPDHTGSTMLLMAGLTAFALLLVVIQCAYGHGHHLTNQQRRETSLGYAKVSLPRDLDVA